MMLCQVQERVTSLRMLCLNAAVRMVLPHPFPVLPRYPQETVLDLPPPTNSRLWSHPVSRFPLPPSLCLAARSSRWYCQRTNRVRPCYLALWNLVSISSWPNSASVGVGLPAGLGTREYTLAAQDGHQGTCCFSLPGVQPRPPTFFPMQYLPPPFKGRTF